MTMINPTRSNVGSPTTLQKGGDVPSLILPEPRPAKVNQRSLGAGEIKLAKLDREQRLLPVNEQLQILKHQGFKRALDFTYKFDPNDQGLSLINHFRAAMKWFNSLQTGAGTSDTWTQINYDEMSAVLAHVARGYVAANNRNVTGRWLDSNVEIVIRGFREGFDGESPYVEATVTVLVKP